MLVKYDDRVKLPFLKENGVDDKAYRKYVKHWGELAGFSMAIQSGRKNLGATAVELNKLIGFGPVTTDKKAH